MPGSDLIKRKKFLIIFIAVCLFVLIYSYFSAKDSLFLLLIFALLISSYLYARILKEETNQAVARNTEIEEQEQIRKEFIENVSHELRTPIASIKGSIETILDGALNDRGDLLKFLNIAFKHCNRLEAVIEELHELSSIERGRSRVQIDFEEHDLDHLINSSIELCSYNAETKSIEVEYRLNTEIKIKVHYRLLERAMVNLIDNAIKYSPLETKVKITIQHNQQYLYIVVSDLGPGISQDNAKRIFERFYRVDRARSRKLGGTGLGLALVKNIMIAHDGDAVVESRVGDGSRFALLLPLDLVLNKDKLLDLPYVSEALSKLH